jgi:hypothetical protein
MPPSAPETAPHQKEVFFLSLLGLLAAVVLGMWTVLRFQQVSFFMVHNAYYFMAALVVLWVFQVLHFLAFIRFSLKSFVARYYPGLLISFFLAIVVGVSVDAHFNFPTGETNALAVSKGMLYKKTILATNVLSPYTGLFSRIEWMPLDVKPFLFPFLLSLFHTLLGYQATNSFILNFVVMGVFLASVWVVVRKHMNTYWSVASLMLVLSCPLFSFCARSGGTDLMATLFLGFIFINVYSLMKNPQTPTFALLWVNLLILAHIREDTFIYFFVILTGLFLAGCLRWRWFKETPLLMAWTPVFAFPLIWQRIILPHPPDPKPAEIAWFGVENFKNNVADLVTAQFDFTYQLPYPTLLHLLAIVLFSYLLITIFVLKKEPLLPYQKYFIAIVLACTVIRYGVVLSWWWPKIYTDPISARLFLPFAMLFALSPVLFAAIRRLSGTGLSKAVLTLSILSFFLYHPIAVNGHYITSVLLTKEATQIHRFLEQRGDKNVLLVDTYAWRFLNFDYHATSFGYAVSLRHRLREDIRNQMLREILVVQRLNPQTLQAAPEETLPPDFLLETVFETRINPYVLTRVSRVKSL